MLFWGVARVLSTRRDAAARDTQLLLFSGALVVEDASVPPSLPDMRGVPCMKDDEVLLSSSEPAAARCCGSIVRRVVGGLSVARKTGWQSVECGGVHSGAGMVGHREGFERKRV